MEIIDISQVWKDYGKLSDKQISIFGWAKTIRDSKKVGFIELNDGTCLKSCQIVLKPELKNYEEVVKQNVGASFLIEGKLISTPTNKQPFEIVATKIEIQGSCPVDYPLQKKKHSMEFLREIAYLRPRTNTFNAVFRIRSIASMAIHTYFQKNGYLYVNTPIITSADCEGSEQMFKTTTLDFDKLPIKDGKVDFSKDLFGKQVFITGSGQLHGETFALAFKKIYTFGPTFRSERSNTKTHANEFWMIEPEVAFCDLSGIMSIEEEMLKFVIKYVFENCPDELKFLDDNVENGLVEKLQKVVNSNFSKITYTEAIKLLQKSGNKWEFEPKFGGDIAKEHEKYITEYFKGPVFVTNWPKDIKAWYMKLNDDKETVAAVDLELPEIGELMGGSQREDDYDQLIQNAKHFNVDVETVDWYVNLRKFGGVKHSGFGLGFERLIMYLTGVENIRDVIPYPRTVGGIDY